MSGEGDDDIYAEDLGDWYAENDPDGAGLLGEVHDTLTRYVVFIDFSDRERPNYASDLRLCVDYMFATLA